MPCPELNVLLKKPRKVRYLLNSQINYYCVLVINFINMLRY
jgi:hypothetical protein